MLTKPETLNNMDIQILSQTNMDNKQTLQNSRKHETYINHTEKYTIWTFKFSVKRIWTTVKQNMDIVKQKPGLSDTEKTLQNSLNIDKSMSGTDMDNIFH